MIRINEIRLCEAVIESGMGEREFCRKAGIAPQTFVRMKNGRMVQFPVVKRVCKALNSMGITIRPAELLIHDEDIQAQGPEKPLYPH